MACSKRFDVKKYVPGSDADAEDIFTFPYIVDENTINYIKSHGRIMFIIRGMPGTGKRSLSKLIANAYPGSDILSADNYFNATFTSQMRSKDSKRESHLYCHKNVLKACKKNVHPIIVCNSHVKKVEMDEYLKIASKFNYTIIMADTSHKFIITPEILAKSNAQGLDVCYFKNRMKQWEVIFPFCTGWFISPHDSHHIINELLNLLEVLQVNQTFFSYLNLNEKGDLNSIYLGKELLFCVAGCGTNNFNPEMKRYYSSREVKGYNGQCFEIQIFAFVFTQSDILALVHIDEDVKKLIFRQSSKTDVPDEPRPEKSDADQISSSLRKMNVDANANLKEYSKTVPHFSSFQALLNLALRKSDILALVHIDEDVKKLIFRQSSKTDVPDEPRPEKSDADQISSSLRKMNVDANANLKEYSKTVPLQQLSSSSKPCFKESIDVKNISIFV
ncbi:2',3'-cyclic-nucleotide 3'-phosphodiesterase-like [Uloborus diversus]|uniref:2',3'-cyclic-nucleotide 3'-phosphodiesterase-like n=1 Tax=Uloborus diversus TaxID=327109 RepID=UPI002408F687|nr:2',3'-cyclic-nucleotide 3'-phosphodiesterase-like [Uloborus diversus]